MIQEHYSTYIQNCFIKADSHKLHLTHMAVADSCVSAEIGNFLFFNTQHFCRCCMRQTQLMWISLNTLCLYNTCFIPEVWETGSRWCPNLWIYSSWQNHKTAASSRTKSAFYFSRQISISISSKKHTSKIGWFDSRPCWRGSPPNLFPSVSHPHNGSSSSPSSSSSWRNSLRRSVRKSKRWRVTTMRTMMVVNERQRQRDCWL